MKNHPWAARWRCIAEIGRGGQGTTFKVESTTNGRVGCMKVLTDNHSRERRERFRRECAAIETLDHQRLPHYLDGNPGQFRTTERLFLVTDYIEGPTLAKAISSRLLSHDDAIRLTIELLHTIEYVHSCDVVHRDIKPDNIILVNGSPANPVLVDFGLSYREDMNALSTASIQQLGNRFLHLPELQVQSGDKRNPITDISQLVGILLYCLTGENPVCLLDEQRQLPHQRDRVLTALKRHPIDVVKSLLPVFDRGFQQSLPERWTSAKQLRSRLESIIAPPSKPSGTSIVDDFTSILFGSPKYALRQAASDAFTEFEKIVRLVFNEVLAEFSGQPFSYGGNQSESFQTLTHTINHFLRVKMFDEVGARFSTSCSVVGNELLVRSQVHGADDIVEIGRVSMKPPRDWADVKTSLRSELHRVIREVIQPQLPNS